MTQDNQNNPEIIRRIDPEIAEAVQARRAEFGAALSGLESVVPPEVLAQSPVVETEVTETSPVSPEAPVLPARSAKKPEASEDSGLLTDEGMLERIRRQIEEA